LVFSVVVKVVFPVLVSLTFPGGLHLFLPVVVQLVFKGGGAVVAAGAAPGVFLGVVMSICYAWSFAYGWSFLF